MKTITPEVAKYHDEGSSATCLWAKRFGGSDGDSSHAVAVDTGGHAVVTGGFSTITDFGGQSLTSLGAADIFLQRLDL